MEKTLTWSELRMVPKQRLGRWVSIGVPAILVEGIAVVLLVHLRYSIELRNLLPPVGYCVAIQIGFFVCAFWARKLAREQSRYGPISFLVGFSSWAMLLIVMHYGPLWGILSPVGDPLSFSLFMVFVTLASWFAVSKMRRS
jgi:hypothetical protein